jgi:hypothetical protein
MDAGGTSTWMCEVERCLEQAPRVSRFRTSLCSATLGLPAHRAGAVTETTISHVNLALPALLFSSLLDGPTLALSDPENADYPIPHYYL